MFYRYTWAEQYLPLLLWQSVLPRGPIRYMQGRGGALVTGEFDFPL